MAVGKVCTGFSKPYVGTYSATGSTVRYTGTTALAKGVDVSVTPNTSSDTIFYADNAASETAAGYFTDGTFSLTVDGLFADAEAMIMGTTAPSGSTWMAYDDDTKIPYVGLGFIVRFRESGVDKYVPVLLPKVTFDLIETAAATQEDTISFQTQSLSGKILRADDAKHTWKWLGPESTSESAAVTALTTKMGASAS